MDLPGISVVVSCWAFAYPTRTCRRQGYENKTRLKHHVAIHISWTIRSCPRAHTGEECSQRDRTTVSGRRSSGCFSCDGPKTRVHRVRRPAGDWERPRHDQTCAFPTANVAGRILSSPLQITQCIKTRIGPGGTYYWRISAANGWRKSAIVAIHCTDYVSRAARSYG